MDDAHPGPQHPAGYCLEDLSVGMSATWSRTVSEADIVAYADLAGDTNPVHLDAAYAATTRFHGRIAHGMLSAGFIATVLGTRLPGPGSIYVSQSLRFRAPVRIGDTVVSRVTISAIQPERRRVSFDTACLVGATAVIEGEAVVMVPSRR